MTQIQEKPSTAHIAAAIESVLFVSGRPLEYDELCKLLDIDASALDEGYTVNLLPSGSVVEETKGQGPGIKDQGPAIANDNTTATK